MGLAALIVLAIVIALIVITILSGIRIVRPTHRAFIERLGKYNRFAGPGIHLTIPFGIERFYRVDIREILVDATPQTIITNDNLNARVDAQVYLKVKPDEESVKASQYNVTNYQIQIVQLARTTLRNIIGTLSLKSANSERGRINEELRTTLRTETANWGLEILRTELKEIDPPADVQETMNKVVKAENEKIAAVDYATATETQADGQRRAEIKKAEGIKQAKVLAAEGEAQAIQLVNEAAEKYFVGNAQVLRKLETVEKAFWQNAKIVVPSDGNLVNVIGDLAGIAPVPVKARAAQPHAGAAAAAAEVDGGREPRARPRPARGRRRAAMPSSCAASSLWAAATRRRPPPCAPNRPPRRGRPSCRAAGRRTPSSPCPAWARTAARRAAATSARSSSERRSIIVSCHTPAKRLPPVKYAGQPNIGRIVHRCVELEVRDDLVEELHELLVWLVPRTHDASRSEVTSCRGAAPRARGCRCGGATSGPSSPGTPPTSRPRRGCRRRSPRPSSRARPR